MDFEEYLEKYNAQEKIDRLAKIYKNRKIVVYGAGQFSNILFKKYDLSKLNITAVCDKKFEDESKISFYNYKCITPRELGDYDCNLILIANYEYDRFFDILDEMVLYQTKNASVEIRPMIRLDYKDLFVKKI